MHGYTNASFSLLATQRRAPITRLVAGQPQQAHLDATEWSYYRLTLPADATGFRISLPATAGDPDLFVQAACPATRPTAHCAPAPLRHSATARHSEPARAIPTVQWSTREGSYP